MADNNYKQRAGLCIFYLVGLSVGLLAPSMAAAGQKAGRLEATVSGAILGAGVGALASGSGPVAIGAAIGSLFGFTYALSQDDVDDKLYASGVVVIDDKYGTSMVLPADRLFAAPDSAVIEPTFYPTLDRVVTAINNYPKVVLSVYGHTDDVYNKKQQQQISELYARKLADHLVANGVDPERIVRVHGYGSRYPIMNNDNYRARAHNRRVEITMHARLPD